MKVRKGFVSNSSSSSFESDDLLDDVDHLIQSLRERGYGGRERLFRKLIEEAGEYGEAIEFHNGSTRKKAKFAGEDSKEKLAEEAADIVMVALALAKTEGLDIRSVLDVITEKLSIRQMEHEAQWKKDQ